MTNAQAALIAAAISGGPGAAGRDPSEVYALFVRYIAVLDAYDEKIKP